MQLKYIIILKRMSEEIEEQEEEIKLQYIYNIFGAI